MSLQPLPFSPMGPYDPFTSRLNSIFEEYTKACNERDSWHTRYIELK